MSTTYSIADLSAEFGITTRTLRHYEEQGLLNPARKGMARIFSGRDRVRLKLALRGKRLGFSLQEIKELFDLYDLAKDERKQLIALTVKEMRLERRLQLIYRKGATLSHAAKAFLRVAKGS